MVEVFSWIILIAVIFLAAAIVAAPIVLTIWWLKLKKIKKSIEKENLKGGYTNAEEERTSRRREESGIRGGNGRGTGFERGTGQVEAGNRDFEDKKPVEARYRVPIQSISDVREDSETVKLHKPSDL